MWWCVDQNAEGKNKADESLDERHEEKAEVDNTSSGDVEDNLEDKAEDPSTTPSSPVSFPVTEDHITDLGKKLEKSWKSLGTELGMAEEELNTIEKEHPKVKDQALKMLSAWKVSQAAWL